MEVWKRLQSVGTLRADLRHVESNFLASHEWMARQMHQRLRVRPPRDSLPVWAWYQWQSEGRKKPDLRSSGHLPKGERGVRIKFERDDRLVLLSDFELWHYVLNYWYLPQSEVDGESFESELSEQGLSFYATKPLPLPYHQRIEKSWERIFDMEWAVEGLAAPKAEKVIQATLWELRIKDVKSCEEFISR